MMRDWITSGGQTPFSHGRIERHRDIGPERWHDRYRRRRRSWSPLAMAVAILLLIPQLHPVSARDVGQVASTTPELKAWFDSLRSGKGPCCSDADGSAVSDVDWESNSGHYRVRLDEKWFDVPDEAVITGPNRVGRTMVWPLRLESGVLIRCFMPGSMT